MPNKERAASHRMVYKQRYELTQKLEPLLRRIDNGSGVTYSEWINPADSDRKVADRLGATSTNIRVLREAAFGPLLHGKTRTVGELEELRQKVAELEKRLVLLEVDLDMMTKGKIT